MNQPVARSNALFSFLAVSLAGILCLFCGVWVSGCASITFTYEPVPQDAPWLVLDEPQMRKSAGTVCYFPAGVYSADFRSVQKGEVLAIYYKAPTMVRYKGSKYMYIPGAAAPVSGLIPLGNDDGTYEGGIVRFVSSGAKYPFGYWVRVNGQLVRSALDVEPLKVRLMPRDEAEKLKR